MGQVEVKCFKHPKKKHSVRIYFYCNANAELKITEKAYLNLNLTLIRPKLAIIVFHHKKNIIKSWGVAKFHNYLSNEI